MNSRVRFVGFLGIAAVLAVMMLITRSTSQAPPVAEAADSNYHTYVAGFGADSGPCFRSAPCRTFTYALSVTSTGGMISCYDVADYGQVTITKSVTINCGEGMGGITSCRGVIVDDPSNFSVVTLRGLAITYDPIACGVNLVENGIEFKNGSELVLDNVRVIGFVSKGLFVPGRSAAGAFVSVSVSNSLFANNGVGQAGGGGIVLGNVPPQGTNNGVIRAVIKNTDMVRNNIGLRVSPNVEATIKSSSMDSNISYNMVAYSGGGGAPSYVNADDCLFTESIGGTGIHSEGFGAQIRVSRSTITGNNIGVAAFNSGLLLSAGNNILQQNFGGNGGFTGSMPLQ